MVETTRELSPISNENFDDFLKEQGLTKAAMAKAMQTSRHQLNNLLDPKNPSLTFHCLQKAANVLGIPKAINRQQVDNLKSCLC